MESKIGLPLVFTLLVLVINSNVDATGPAAPAAGGAAPAGGGTVFDITKYGATPNGDATQGVMCAWKEACAATSPSEILIPVGEYTLGPVKLEGPCKSNITITINGNFKAVSADKFTKEDNAWFKIKRVSGVTMKGGPGGGVFDGQGPLEWSKNDCKKNKDCKLLPYNFRFDFINDSTICGITSKDSKAFHIDFQASHRVDVKNVVISAPAESPNTDGIHVSRSDCIRITDTKIGTGDDCVSIINGSKNITVEKVTCGPGHGFSIGSVGEVPDENPLTGITVKCCNLTGTDNGVRIKTWLDSFENTVSGVLFEQITVDNVENPIMIDQEYCPNNQCKSQAPSKVKLSDITIKNVKGTSSSVEVVTISCSATTPCEKIEVSDVDLKYVGKEQGTATFVCKNIKPVTSGVIVPPPCTSEVTKASEKSDKKGKSGKSDKPSAPAAEL